jgi:hypothetical protein
MKYKKLLGLLFLFSFLTVQNTYSQNEDSRTVTYVDSVNEGTRFTVKSNRVQRLKADTMQLQSRLGKIKVKFVDDFFTAEGVQRCLRLALDLWEDKIEIKAPVNIYLNSIDDSNDKVEMKTIISYYTDKNVFLPTSLYIQDKNLIHDFVDTITINSSIDWDYSWSDDVSTWGNNNLTTALIRHIAHILGFGSSVSIKNGLLQFPVQSHCSPFDNLISDGEKTLGDIALTATSSDIENFLKKDISITANGRNYRLFSSKNEYVPYRSGNYFTDIDNSPLNYPYKDLNSLLPIDYATLDVLSAVGWNVAGHDVLINGSDLNAAGVGNIYVPHTFNASDYSGKSINSSSWKYQEFDYNTHSYVDIKSELGSSITISPQNNKNHKDNYNFQQGRVICTVSESGLNKDYTFPVFLDSRPLFLNFSLYNINDIPGTNYCSFDVDISKLGNKKGELLVSSDYGSLCSFNLDESESSTFHVPNALKSGNLYLNITLENDYGTTTRTIDLGKYPNLMTSDGINILTPEADSVNDNESDIEIFDMQGVKISNAKKLSDLKSGLYIIRNIKRPWNTRKIMVK